MNNNHICLSEQETIINWDNEQATATVYTFDQRLAGKLKSLACIYPEQFELLEKGPQRCVTYRVPKRCINIRPPYSEKRRLQQKEDARRNGFALAGMKRERSEG